MLITEKIEKIKKNKVLITEKIQKINKNINDFFKGLKQFFLKFNYPQPISKQLTILIKC